MDHKTLPSGVVGGEGADGLPGRNILAGEDNGMTGDVGAVADDRGLEADFFVVRGIVREGIDAAVGTDDGVLADGDAAAIVEQGTLANNGSVADGEVVAVGQVDSVMNFDACAEMLEDVAAQHAAKTQSQPVIEAERRAVEHLPEPEQGFAAREAFAVDFSVVLSFEGHVQRVEREIDYVAGQLGAEREIEFAAVGPTQIDLRQLVAHDLAAALLGAVLQELFVEKANPATIDFFGFGGGMGDGNLGGGHTLLTINQEKAGDKGRETRDSGLR